MLMEILTGILGLVFLAGAWRQFHGQGPLWSPEYLAASDAQRKRMRSRRNYLRSAVICLVIGLALSVLMLYSLTDLKVFLYGLFLLCGLLFVLLVLEGISSSRKRTYEDDEKKGKRGRRD